MHIQSTDSYQHLYANTLGGNDSSVLQARGISFLFGCSVPLLGMKQFKMLRWLAGVLTRHMMDSSPRHQKGKCLVLFISCFPTFWLQMVSTSSTLRQPPYDLNYWYIIMLCEGAPTDHTATPLYSLPSPGRGTHPSPAQRGSGYCISDYCLIPLEASHIAISIPLV